MFFCDLGLDRCHEEANSFEHSQLNGRAKEAQRTVVNIEEMWHRLVYLIVTIQFLVHVDTQTVNNFLNYFHLV